MSENQSSSWKTKLLYNNKPDDDRSRMKAVANNVILHLHPAKVAKPALRFSYTWGLGGLSTMLALVLITTGVLMMFRYDASVERAYTSVQAMETDVLFGSLTRAMHHWSANLLVVTAFLHMLRVFYTGGYKNGRSTNWTIGLILFLIILAFNFTGYLLPWDQLAYWAITVGTSLLSYIPVVGDLISNFLLAGPEVGQGALRNFYAIHVSVLPVLFTLLMAWHFWKVRKDGGISQPIPPERTRIEKVTTIPHLVQIELAAAIVLITTLLLWSMAVPAPLEALADPLHPPNPAKAAWYFMGVQELLLHMDALAAMILTGIGMVAIFLIPKWDKQGDDIGIYFRSARGRVAAIVGILWSIVLVPILVVVDEYWLDLPAMFPDVSNFIINGVVPLLATFTGLAFIYMLIRVIGRLTHSETLVGLFSFIFSSLILLTIVGVFFRGANMALVLPF